MGFECMMIHSINIYVITVQLLIPSTCMHLRRKIKIIYYDHLFCIFSIIRDNVKIPTWEHKQKENPLFCIVRIIHGKGDFCIKVNTSNALNHINVSFPFTSCIIYLLKIRIISFWACQIGEMESRALRMITIHSKWFMLTHIG